jgi:hypothetical protein
MYEVTEWNDSDSENSGYEKLADVYIGNKPSQTRNLPQLVLFKKRVSMFSLQWLYSWYREEDGNGNFVIVLLQEPSSDKDVRGITGEDIALKVYEGQDSEGSLKAFEELKEFFSILMSHGESSYSLEQIQKLITPKGPVSKKDLLVHLTQSDIPGPLSHEDLQTYLHDYDEEGNSPLHLAANSGSYHVIEKLFSLISTGHLHKFDNESGYLNSVNTDGENPLIMAAKQGQFSAVLLLLLHDSNPNSHIAGSGNTALHIAASLGFPLIVKALILFGANVDTVNNDGKTALVVAMATPSSNETTECVKILQEIKSLEDNKPTAPKKPAVPLPSASAPVLLCLDGGGVRGLVEVVILSELDVIMRELDPGMTNLIDYFDFTAGTSTGSFIVASLVYRNQSLSNLKKMYFHFKNAVFSHEKPIEDSVADTAAKEAFGDTQVLKDVTSPKVMIATTIPDFEPPIQHLMCNYGAARDGQKGPEERKLWEACRASSAAPTYFVPFEDRFIDGGIIANNPTLDAMTEVLKLQESGKEPLSLGMVVSLGTGVCPEPIDTPNIPHVHWWNPVDIWKAAQGVENFLQVMVSEITASNGVVVERAKAWCKSIECPYFRLSPKIQSVKLAETDDKILINMMYETLIYARRNRSTLQEIAVSLLSRKK